MTIIAILIALAINHFVKGISVIRRSEWLTPMLRLLAPVLSKLEGQSAVAGALLLLLVPMLVLTLLAYIVYESLGMFFYFLFAVIVLIYCIGPRDLDGDVKNVVNAGNENELQDAARPLLHEPLAENPDERGEQFIRAVFREGLIRWFAVIFWFALLGIYGAAGYRLCVWLARTRQPVDDDQREWLKRFSYVLEWPVAQLMTLALAVAADFDTVLATWRKHHKERGHGILSGDHGFMLTAAVVAVQGGHAANDGFADQLSGRMGPVKLAMDLLWRVLAVWLTLLAVMLLAGWLA